VDTHCKGFNSPKMCACACELFFLECFVVECEARDIDDAGILRSNRKLLYKNFTRTISFLFLFIFVVDIYGGYKCLVVEWREWLLQS